MDTSFLQSPEMNYVIESSAITLTVASYASVLIFGICNTYKYLYRQGRYKSLPLLLFYMFSILLCATRLGRYIAMIVMFALNMQVYSLLSLLINMLCSFFIAAVGITQVLTMQELTACL